MEGSCVHLFPGAPHSAFGSQKKLGGVLGTRLNRSFRLQLDMQNIGHWKDTCIEGKS